MNIIKKIGISLIGIILITLAICNLVNAEYQLGDVLELDYIRDYAPNKNMYCVEKGQDFGQNYTVISKVAINGTKSTDYNNKIIDSIENAKLAYILSSADEYPYEIKEESVLQKAVWTVETEWMNAVGKDHYCKHSKDAENTLLGMDFIGSHNHNYTTTDPDVIKLINDATEYANNIQVQKQFTDNTQKDNIKIESYQKDGTKYLIIGDFNWTFGGKLKEIKAYDQDNNIINNISYVQYKGNNPEEITIDKISSGNNFCIAIPAVNNINSIKKITGLQEIDSKYVEITFLESEWNSLQNLVIADPKTSKDPIEASFDYDIPLLGNLKVIKVDQRNNEIKLPNVGFYIQNKTTGKYVKQTGTGKDKTISYVDRTEATEFLTDTNGEINIEGLMVGTYVAYETKNPNHGYKIVEDGMEKEVIIDKTAELKITNKQEFVKLSGYVWVDRVSGKQSKRNNLYKEGESDSNDFLLDGIKVKLIDKETKDTIKETTTSNGGAYKFVDVLVDDLENYYIEFEYDGLIYKSVPSALGKNNGSKSIENSTTRTAFNNSFAVVEGGERENTGITKDLNGNVTHNLSYTRISNENERKSILNNGNYKITATTDDARYSIKEHYTAGQEEIKFINLGLYEREMPDIHLEKDIENVELSINGFHHIYNYGSKKLDNYDIQKDDEGFNVGVSFGDEFKGTYKRAVYTPDYNYTVQNADKDNKLNVYLTYRIALYNEATDLKSKVNSIVDYYDKNFTIEKIGTEINKETGEITGNNISYTNPELQGEYNKVIIQNNTTIDSGKTKSIYVRFKLSDSEVQNAFNDDKNGKVTYKNIAEVNSYTTFDASGNVYAGIDKDSAPGNAVPGSELTYEDDTNNAPGIQLDVQGNRTISGTVFLDESLGGVAQVRLGDGMYKPRNRTWDFRSKC